jgi:flagellar motor switch/type III secretory pathway protein FliN
MSTRPWLPKDAFLGAATKDVLSEPVAAWSARWVARAPAGVSKLRFAEGGASARSQTTCGRHVALDLTGIGRRHLLEAVLDVSLAESPRSDADARVLDAVVQEICEDFVRTLDEVFADEPCEDEDRGLRATVAIGRNDVFEFAVAAPLLVPLIKRQLGGAVSPGRPLSRLSTALREAQIQARAVLGHVDLSLSEMRELNAGDVVVIDRAIGDPVELHLPQSSRPLARGKLARNGDQLSIQL